MYAECDIDTQCNGTYGGGVCKEVDHRKLCMCENGYVEDNSDFTCRKGDAFIIVCDKLHIDDSSFLI